MYQYLLTYSLVELTFIEKPPVVQPLKNFLPFYGTRRFITVFTRALHWSLSWARPIHSIPSYHGNIYFNIVHPPKFWSSWRSLSPCGFPTNILYAFLFSPPRATFPAHFKCLRRSWSNISFLLYRSACQLFSAATFGLPTKVFAFRTSWDRSKQ
jgi:hypothetical protein